jgi:CheY-like chemotaxis protein
MDPAKYILVVEDVRIVAKDIQRSLIDLGYDVPDTAATAEEAIRLASERGSRAHGYSHQRGPRRD